jgi:DNA gyrase subunit B
MRPLVEKGYLYIARPPLYRVKRGTSQVYIRDEKALEDYLLDSAVLTASLKLSSGEVIASNDIRSFVLKAEKIKKAISHINNKVNNALLLEGLLLLRFVQNQDKAAICTHLKKIDQGEWSVEDNENNYVFSKTLRNVTEVFEVSKSILGQWEIQNLSDELGAFSSFSRGFAELKMKDLTMMVKSPMDFLEKFMSIARKGITLSRFKGLGEMDAEQLWETTIDPNARVLMQVKFSHLEEVDEIISTLMGEVVEPRRDFIQENALNVVNLDV